jgi:hypothetical protein
MRPYVISTAFACLLATATAVSADGPRGHTLGADTARLAPGAADPLPSPDGQVAADAGARCPAAADGACPAPAALEP